MAVSHTRKSKKKFTMVVKSLHRSLDVSWISLNFSELERVRSYNENIFDDLTKETNDGTESIEFLVILLVVVRLEVEDR